MSDQEQVLDLRVLLKVFTEHIIPILLVAVIAAGAGYCVSNFLVAKRYTSEALMYVENSASKQDDSAININDINAAQKLVNTCQILFTSDYVFGELNQHFGGIYTNAQLGKMIKISSVNNTEVLNIKVESDDPVESYNVACELIVLATREFQRVIKNGSIETVSPPQIPDKHNFPSNTMFTAVGGVIGFALIYFVFLIKEMLDVKVKNEDDLAIMYDLPVFAEILDFEVADRTGGKYVKYSKYSGYDSYSKDPDNNEKTEREEALYSEEYEEDIDEEDNKRGRR